MMEMSREEGEKYQEQKWVLLKQRYQPKSTGQKQNGLMIAEFACSYDKLTHKGYTQTFPVHLGPLWLKLYCFSWRGKKKNYNNNNQKTELAPQPYVPTHLESTASFPYWENKQTNK